MLGGGSVAPAARSSIRSRRPPARRRRRSSRRTFRGRSAPSRTTIVTARTIMAATRVTTRAAITELQPAAGRSHAPSRDAVPNLTLLALSDSFSAMWPALATECGLGLAAVREPAAFDRLTGSVGIVSGAGVEEQLEPTLRAVAGSV